MVRTILSFVVLIAASSLGRTANPSDRIDKAVERGVLVLRTTQQPNGGWHSYGMGSTTLAALAMLECGVKPDDPAIMRAAALVRDEMITNNEVYHVSLAIMFLDRLGDAIDEPLIQALTVRLMEAQYPNSGWSYKTHKPSSEEAERLRGLSKKSPELKTEPNKKVRRRRR